MSGRAGTAGTISVVTFGINLAARKYTVWYGPPPEVRGCTFEFEGTFSLRDGVWVADDPVEVRSALGAGR
jgi:hypothetical protein